MFMEFLDGYILPTAAPTIARSFHILSPQVGICVTTYMVSALILIPISAWMTDKYGVRRVLFGGIFVFVLASLGCALSTNLLELTIMRIVQGVGAATMVPVGRLILMRSVDKDQVIRAISYSVWPALAAPVVAPVLGGFIIEHSSWHWIFLVNIPIGLLALFAGWKIVPRIPGGRAEKLDWFGFYGLAGSLGLLVFAAANLGAPHIDLPVTLLLFFFGIGLGVPTVLHLRGTKDPLIDLQVLAIQTFHLNTTSGLLFRVAQNSAPFLLPLLFQDKFGWSPQRAGSVLFFYLLGNLTFKIFTTPLMKRFAFKPLILICTFISIPLSLILGLISASLSTFWIAIILIITGGIRSLGMTLYNTITFADTDQEVMSHANTVANMVQQLSTVVAVAAAVVALNIGRAAFGLPNQFTFAFFVMVGVLALSLPNALRLPANAGEALRN